MDEEFCTLADYEHAAEERMPEAAWDFAARGAMDEVTARRNVSGFGALALRPRVLRDVRKRSTATTILGAPVSLPVFLAPAGHQSIAHAEGERETARAGAATGTLMIVPARIVATPSEVATAHGGPTWFQMYHHSWEETTALVDELQESGYVAICLTVDAPMLTRRQMSSVLSPARRAALWRLGGGGVAADDLHLPVSWDDVVRLCDLTSLPVVLKGITNGDDARLAVEAGASAVYVSTHAGRLFDSTPGAIEVLGEVVDAVGGRVEVYLDSGVRRGSDVVKALALGAQAVGIGQPIHWGLAVAGEAGVRHVVEILRAELDMALAFCGCASAADVDRSLVAYVGAQESVELRAGAFT